MRKKIIVISLLLVVVILPGCALKPPMILQVTEPEKLVALNSTQLQQSIGQTVRWGGVILETINNKNSGQIVVLGYELDSRARPDSYGRNSTRRFIAEFDNFIEPNNYSNKRDITIIGTIDRFETKKIGDFDYQYPVISVKIHALWPDYNYYADNYYYNSHDSWSGYHNITPYYWNYDSHYYPHHY